MSVVQHLSMRVKSSAAAHVLSETLATCLRIMRGMACRHRPLHAALRRLHRAARCRFSWKMKCAAGYPRGTAGKGWKTKEGKHGNVSSDSTSQGTLTSSRENQNKNPLLAAKASTTGRWGRGGEVEGGRTMKPLSFPPDGCLLTAQSFCSARIRGHCCALRGCQTL